MRAVLLIGLLLAAACAALALFLLGSPRAGDVAAPRPGGAEPAPAGPAEPGGSAREAVPPADPPAVPPAPAADPMPGKDEDAFWRRCAFLPPAEVRDCIRAGLAGRVLPAEELARLACAGGLPDGADRLLLTEAFHLWAPEDVLAGLATFAGLCPEEGELGIALVRELFPRDPDWCVRLAASIRPELVFGSGSRTLLVLVDALAEAGFADERLVLEAGARGDYGGSDGTVAFAVTNAWALQRDAQARIEFLSGLVRSPGFAGREQELGALLDCATESTLVEADPTAALGLIESVLASPRLSEAAARRLLELHRFGRLPRWLTRGEGERLIARARELAGGG